MQKFFQKAQKDFLTKHQESILFECPLFEKKKSDDSFAKVWFFRIYETFLLISEVCFHFKKRFLIN